MRKDQQAGFTLTELVAVIVVLAVLTAVAVPKFQDMGRVARVAVVQSALGAVNTAARVANLQCKLSPGCDVNFTGAFIRGPSGEMNAMFSGFPTGVSRPNAYFGIRDWVTLDGFTIVENFSSGSTTEFMLTSAPDPARCKVTYIEVAPTINSTVDGC